MPDKKKTCFVVMGFGEKVDFATGRKLNLNASYENLIKPAVEEAGLECVRADEIVHSGNINVPMYERILTSDLVIADLSTSNSNAFYELGVRHALRPYTTIIIAEDQFKFPFDIAQITVRTYRHLGEDIGASEARRFTRDLTAAIKTILAEEKDDSPVYTFLNRLRRLKLPDDMNYGPEAEAGAPGASPSLELAKRAVAEAAPGGTGGAAGETSPAAMTHSMLMQQVAEAKKRSELTTAKALLSSVRVLMKGSHPDKPEDPYIIQQLALVTYKSKLPTPQQALEEARALLETLAPATSNDTETLGMWGAVHKRLADLTKERAHLDEAVRGYGRGYRLRNDYYNGINFAYMLNARAVDALERAAAAEGDAERARLRAEAIADFVQAERVRREVISICEELLTQDEAAAGGDKLPADSKYWVQATLAEAHAGVGDMESAQRTLDKASETAPAGWMTESTREQIDRLRNLLQTSPLGYVRADRE